MTTNDRTIAAIGLPRHPRPKTLIDHIHTIAKLLEHVDLEAAIRVAPLLAARGWPAGTLGDGGSSTGASILVTDTDTGPDGERVPVSSVEAAALARSRFDDADRQLATALAVIDQAVRIATHHAHQAAFLASDLLAHADDVDELPAASGACEACGKVVRNDPTKGNTDHLRKGLCNACRMHWERSGITDRGDWLLARRAMLRHREGAEALTSRFRQALDDGHLEAS